jgi:hypothetical protein
MRKPWMMLEGHSASAAVVPASSCGVRPKARRSVAAEALRKISQKARARAGSASGSARPSHCAQRLTRAPPIY